MPTKQLQFTPRDLESISAKDFLRAFGELFITAPSKLTEPRGRAVASNNGPGIAASWQRDDVKEARTTRHRVLANGREFHSVREAFVALRLPIAKHIPFRRELKEAGKAVFKDGAGHKVRFQIMK